MPVAAVDCGTNSTRLLIAAPDGSTVERRMQITRLGHGVDRTGRLDADAIARTVAVLVNYRGAMDAAGVTRCLAVATSAVRDAGNAEEFLDRAGAVLGAPPQVLSGDAEGRLSYRGATDELDPNLGPYLVVDIGGGSTELVTARGGQGTTLVEAVSLAVGCVRITERFLRSDPPSPTELAQASAFVRGLLVEARAAVAFEGAGRMVGLAGTVSALAVLRLGRESYDREAVHHTALGVEDVRRLLRELAAMPVAERRAVRGMERDRADVLVGGAVVLETIMDHMGFDELVVSESDILDGIVAELLGDRAE